MLVAFDITLMRPACVLIAAAMGASTEAAKQFDPEVWLLAPTPDMRLFETTPAQLARLVATVKKA